MKVFTLFAASLLCAFGVQGEEVAPVGRNLLAFKKKQCLKGESFYCVNRKRADFCGKEFSECPTTTKTKVKKAVVGKTVGGVLSNITALDYDTVRSALQEIVADKDGFGLEMWATIVNRDGEVKMVVMSGDHRGDQWPGSRVISAQKANTANAFSLPGLSLSTANLYSATQPGGSLYGLQHSNPVDTTAAYAGPSEDYGTPKDPLIGSKIGGVNVFGGGLPLYNSEGTLLGGLGLSGDSSVADHIKAWKLRDALGLDYVPGGVSPTGDDNMVLDIGGNGKSEGGWGHPGTTDEDGATVAALIETYPIGK